PAAEPAAWGGGDRPDRPDRQGGRGCEHGRGRRARVRAQGVRPDRPSGRLVQPHASQPAGGAAHAGRVMTTFFLSYARTNQEIALRFADALIEAGVSVWVDQYDILPSQHWDQAVETALRGCRGMLVMLSPASVASPNVADEVAVALESGKQVVPVLIEPCI